VAEAPALALQLPAEFLDSVVALVTPIVLERLAAEQPEPSPYFTVDEAAEFLRAKPQRVHDLFYEGKLTRYKDGARTLVLRDELRAYAAGEPFPPRSPRRRSSRSTNGFPR
jgi:excisionase family DNA binding protein